MIKGIGIDIVELERIRKNIRQSNRLVDRILTRSEKDLYSRLQSENRQVEFLAGRFAAKEAFAKAVGTGIGKLSFQDIEVLKNEYGAPTVTAKGHERNNVFISITHSRDYAVAQIVIEE